MTKEQATIEYRRLIDEKLKKENEIMEKAKANGNWGNGLDSNDSLFAELNKEYHDKISLLKSLVQQKALCRIRRVLFQCKEKGE